MSEIDNAYRGITKKFENMPDIDRLSYATTMIHIEENECERYGTGFFFNFSSLSSDVIVAGDSVFEKMCLVTNRHVVSNGDTASFYVHSYDKNRDLVEDKTLVKINNLKNAVIFHPDSKIDLAVVPLTKYTNEICFVGSCLTKDDLPTKEQLSNIKPADNVIMVGYPIGLWDSVNNMPIFRQGILATNPELDYEGEKSFLIDAACFPGSSGSPVLLYETFNYISVYGAHKIPKKLFFLGIQSGTFMHGINGEIKIVDIPTTKQPVPQMQIPSLLGIVVKSSCILDFENLIPSTDK